MFHTNREKSLRHIAIVATFLDDKKPKIHLKRKLAVWLKLHRSYSIPFNVSIVRDISGVESEGTVPKFTKTKRIIFLSCGHLLYKAGAWNEDVSCRSRATTAKKCAKKRDTRANLLFCKLTPIGFHFSCCPRLCCCLRCLLLWSRHFATIVTWRHTPPLYRYWILYFVPLAFLSFFPPSISSLPSSLIIYFFLMHSFLSFFHSFSLAGCKNKFSFKFCRRMRKYCGHGDKNGRYMRSKCRFSCGCV